MCRCDPALPAPAARARERRRPCFTSPAGSSGSCALVAGEPVAIVGARRRSPYGLEVGRVARARARGARASRSSAAWRSGSTRPRTPARSPAGRRRSPCCRAAPSAPYPAERARALPPDRRDRRGGLGAAARACGVALDVPGAQPDHRRAAAMTVVVEAARRSGALLTAAFARELGRPVGAVPGRVTSPLSAGPQPAAAPPAPRRPRAAGRARRAVRRRRRGRRGRESGCAMPPRARGAAGRRSARGLEAADALGEAGSTGAGLACARGARAARATSGAAPEGGTPSS